MKVLRKRGQSWMWVSYRKNILSPLFFSMPKLSHYLFSSCQRLFSVSSTVSLPHNLQIAPDSQSLTSPRKKSTYFGKDTLLCCWANNFPHFPPNCNSLSSRLSEELPRGATAVQFESHFTTVAMMAGLREPWKPVKVSDSTACSVGLLKLSWLSGLLSCNISLSPLPGRNPLPGGVS